jgi:sulfur-oxidizing protein SoxY
MEDELMKRRHFLTGTLGFAWALTATWLLAPVRVWGAWTQQAFLSRDVNAALDALIGRVEIVPDQRVTLDVPDLAENGAMVPVVLGTSLQGADSLILVSEPNPFPLIAHFYLTPRLRSTITTRIRMGGSGDVVAIVRAGGRYYGARRHVRVAAGGC